jgi:3-hydroxyacyl-[acyl-carrier-protein] dehydratase
VYLSSANKLKFKKKIIPGDRLLLDVKLNGWKRGIGNCSGVGIVGDEIACQAEFILIMPDIINEYKINNR